MSEDINETQEINAIKRLNIVGVGGKFGYVGRNGDLRNNVSLIGYKIDGERIKARYILPSSGGQVQLVNRSVEELMQSSPQDAPRTAFQVSVPGGDDQSVWIYGGVRDGQVKVQRVEPLPDGEKVVIKEVKSIPMPVFVALNELD